MGRYMELRQNRNETKAPVVLLQENVRSEKGGRTR